MRLSKCLCLWVFCPWVAWALDINQASEADLDSLRGVGPATTLRVLAERGQRPFTDWADLMARVKGLRARAARKLSDQGLTVNGLPFDTKPGG
jgi:competence protein ComEA